MARTDTAFRQQEGITDDSTSVQSVIEQIEEEFTQPSTPSSRESSSADSTQGKASEKYPFSRYSPSPKPKQSSFARQWARKLFFQLLGTTGTTLLSLLALGTSLALTDILKPFPFPLVGMLIAVRLSVGYFSSPPSVFAAYPIRKRVRQVLRDESLLTAGLIVGAYLFDWNFPRLTAGVFFIGNLCLQLGWYFLAQLTLKSGITTSVSKPSLRKQEIVILGTGDHAKQLTDAILNSPELDVSIKGFLDYRKTGFWRYRDIPLLGSPDILEKLIAAEQVDALVIAVEAEDFPHLHGVVETAEAMGVPLCFSPLLYTNTLSSVRLGEIGNLPLLRHQGVSDNKLAWLIKNTMDKIGALVGIVLTAPLMLAAAVAIKLDSPGPILFKQRRSGLHGRTFLLYKFRTMHSDAEKQQELLKELNVMSGPVFKAKNDPRITRVGRILRKYSIDEVPQFFNVLKGDMSLVGPRPPLPKEVVQYEPWQHRRLSIKPGITCLWQINGRNHIDFDQWMRLDLQYIENWSLWEDAKILVRTIPAVIKATGAL